MFRNPLPDDHHLGRPKSTSLYRSAPWSQFLPSWKIGSCVGEHGETATCPPKSVPLSSWAHNYGHIIKLHFLSSVAARCGHGLLSALRWYMGRSDECHCQVQPTKNLPCALSMSFPLWFVGLSMPSETQNTTAENAKPSSAWVSDEHVEKTLCRDLNWVGNPIEQFE